MNLSALHSEAIRLSSSLAEGLAENIAIVKQISAELRTLSYVLHPPLLDEMGLESALPWYVDAFAEASSIKVNLELPGKMGRLPRDLEIAMFRVVQECLSNIKLHSESPTASILLRQSAGKIILEVKDEGKGIPPVELTEIMSTGLSKASGGLGLKGMRQRIEDMQGDMEIISQRTGTQIRIVVPFAASAAQ